MLDYPSLLTVVIWIVLVILPTNNAGNELVRLLRPSTSPTDGPNFDPEKPPRGILEVRRSPTDVWRKVCGQPGWRVTSPVPVAACKDLGFLWVDKVEIGGEKLLGDLWATFDTSQCPAVPATLGECGEFSPASGHTHQCNKQRRWIYLTCSGKAPATKDPSIIQCGEFHSMKTGEDLTLTVTDAACKVNLTSEDPAAIVLVKPVTWPADLTFPGDAGQLRFRVFNGTILGRDEVFCSAATKKATRISAQQSLEIIHEPSSTNTREHFNISISARKQLTCSINAMAIRMLKTDIQFVLTAGGSSVNGTNISVTADVLDAANLPCVGAPVNVESDVVELQIDNENCGLTSIDENGEKGFGSAVTFSDVLPITQQNSAIEYLRKTKYGFTCHNAGWNVTSQDFTLTP